jgi:hypothetical protein
MLLMTVLSCAAWPAAAADAAPTHEIIPGSELMTARERERYRERMRAAGSREKQAQVREEHVKQMRERARLRGLELAPLSGKDAR